MLCFAAREKSASPQWQGAAPAIVLHFNLHPAGQPKDDPVLGVHRHAVDQRSPKALVKLGDELRQGLHAFDEPLDLPAPDHDLVDLLDDRMWYVLRCLVMI